MKWSWLGGGPARLTLPRSEVVWGCGWIWTGERRGGLLAARGACVVCSASESVLLYRECTEDPTPPRGVRRQWWRGAGWPAGEACVRVRPAAAALLQPPCSVPRLPGGCCAAAPARPRDARRLAPSQLAERAARSLVCVGARGVARTALGRRRRARPGLSARPRAVELPCSVPRARGQRLTRDRGRERAHGVNPNPNLTAGESERTREGGGSARGVPQCAEGPGLASRLRSPCRANPVELARTVPTGGCGC